MSSSHFASKGARVSVPADRLHRFAVWACRRDGEQGRQYSRMLRTTRPIVLLRRTHGQVRHAARLVPINAHESAPVETNESKAVSGGPLPGQVAMPQPPHNLPMGQAPNRIGVWSKTQNPKANAMRGPRFEQTSMDFQPQPVAAIELIAKEPIRLVNTRIASCDGGRGALGHPQVYINLDKPGSKACPYCGIRFEREHGIHGHH
ncbi:uncharacterized protein L969DRAFT_95989 [Mixia osmundae IAM 14324]|uniref:Zinc finger CHCC-type domain-containing protein n=1 Tax=Mixia osmundae (strain CBS 9802 / IAM 14324 / JCM 22182 / KY 12970) TaxID=764103 RepID=G7DWT8_MIXOS|nr:uncharacterized protein L969DRAFT_55627 [Mixia osmundae IAM 14324]XP_014566719.1 uncharacterized protein L969DRAFT_95989 [Mixia osmundae IAM 14324]KEI36188.1 hypothetical protein L969DRAFT_55627 [Mixia osmundae IAM 14324]KEI38156.1 hypothetical protein L969DRAFT_95989 [Mixia osmundae IAM 14324]GAA95035.1 hypothetical protein E5Q_01690 [Mixia osmundae IAM 14324]